MDEIWLKYLYYIITCNDSIVACFVFFLSFWFKIWNNFARTRDLVVTTSFSD